MDEKTKADLPPLPGSDEVTLRRDHFDSFYKKRPSDVWQGKIERIDYHDPEKCDHRFVENPTGVECKKCRMGLSGRELRVIKGHVYFRSQKLL